jgi:hypothetical protein
VLHATFFGVKRHDADVENLAFSNISSFRVAGRNGIRFERGDVVPAARDGAEYAFRYRYALAPRSGDFPEWQPGRPLASFGWTARGGFADKRRPAQVWLALALGNATEGAGK